MHVQVYLCYLVSKPVPHASHQQDPQCKDELFSRFESVQIERAIRETSAQPLPDDMENIQELLKEPDDSEDSSLLASSRVAGVVLGRSTPGLGPPQNLMHG